MQRCLIALVASIALALGASVGVASANGTLVPPAPVAPAQSNVADQAQVQVVPIAPQVNVQNVNVATVGEVEQGNANNANTGQASQQENTAGATRATPAPAPRCGSCGAPAAASQRNDSDQSQVQIVPVAPQANVQNVNVLAFGRVEQGNANNANTGQASQQQNVDTTARGSTPTSKPCGCENQPRPLAKPKPKHHTCCQHTRPHHHQHASKLHSRPEPSRCGSYSRSGRNNVSCQRQFQFLPIAPQVNVQNVNVLTFGRVEQGNANNANTGQANQQQNSRHLAPCGCGSTGGQSNRSEQTQLQIVPIAPQLNVQNVNVLTFGDVEQGNVNNANTGQASQQSNTAGAGRTAARPPLVL